MDHLLQPTEIRPDLLYLAVEHMPAGLIVIDAACRIVQANAAAEALLQTSLPGGASFIELAGRVLCQTDGAPCAADELPLVQSARRGEPRLNVGLTTDPPGGQARHLLVNSVPLTDEQGQPIGAAGVFHDITEQVEQRRALESEIARLGAELNTSQARLRTIFQKAAFGMALLDAEGRIVESNPALHETLGCTAAQLRSHYLADFTDADGKHADAQRFSNLAEGRRQHHSVERQVFLPEQQSVWLDVTVSAVSRADEGEGYSIALIEDVTQRKRAQNALVQAEKLAITGRLAASLAHEISNPLQSVIGCIGLVEEMVPADDDAARYLQVAREEVQRVARIVRQLRDVNRRSTPEERKPTDLNTLLGHALTLCKKGFDDRGIKVNWNRDADLPLLWVVPDRIQQVFLNLMLNAIDAMANGGRFMVKTTATKRPHGVRVLISDSGSGIAPELTPYLFQPFHTTKADGLGLGLYTTHNIIEEHGGYIEVTSRPGRGSTFKVWLPVQESGPHKRR